MTATAVIVSGARTPIGKFLGALAPVKAPDLGAVAIKAAMERAKLGASDPDEVIFGKYGGSEVEVNGEEYKILRESDILAKVV